MATINESCDCKIVKGIKIVLSTYFSVLNAHFLRNWDLKALASP